MSKKQKHLVLEKLKEYFSKKGKILTQDEYIKAEDKPFLLSGVRRLFRSYAHMLEVLKQVGFKIEPVKQKDEHGIAPQKPIVQPKPAAAVKPAGIKPAIKEK